ncbi:MAG TPA: hypothetical protein VKR43_12860 [Bryobacteraceae bacterium]|jgi:hypothetical protein|nr:hypothetical protein [Bryobacteraceae bacterium]
MRSLVVFCAGTMWLHAQSAELTPETLLLAKIRQHMSESLQRQPNYTCVETVERSNRTGAARKFQLGDTLRLEVALVDGKEMFGWPGAKKFEDGDLRTIVPNGAIGNGNFALHARAIFQTSAATFDYRGNEDGAVRYDFRVPLMLSGYKIQVADKEAIVAYHGYFVADPTTLDVRRIEVVADDIPRSLGMAQAIDQVDYARLRIGDGDFLLPTASELTMVDLDKQEHRNRVRFASCKQFTGESVLTFDEAPAVSSSPPAPLAEVDVPAGMGLTLSLLDAVDADRSAIGDPVRARLDVELKQKGRLLFSKGAIVSGRVTRVDRQEQYTLLGIEFSEIESDTARARITPRFDDLGGGDGMLIPRARRPSFSLRPGEGVIPLRPGHHRLERGILMFWRT